MQNFDDFYKKYATQNFPQLLSKLNSPDNDSKSKIANIMLDFPIEILRNYHDWLVQNFDLSPKDVNKS